jgi:hypothetical protein
MNWEQNYRTDEMMKYWIEELNWTELKDW